MVDKNEPPNTRRAPPKLLPRTVEVMGARISHPGEEPTRPDVPFARRAQRSPTLTASPAPPPAEQTPISGQARSLPPPLPVREPVAPIHPSAVRTIPGGVVARQEPGRSVSPNPESVAARVTIGDTEVPVKKKHLRALWVWVAPVIISALGTSFGYVKGYAKGLLDGHDEIVRMREEQNRQHDAIIKLESRTDGIDGALAKEEQSGRAERATALRKLSDFATDMEEMKKALPKIQGLPNK